MNLNGKLIARVGLGILTLMMAALTIPAYFDPTVNPGLANLTPELASLGSVAGTFLGRQLTVLIIAAIGIVVASRSLLMVGAFGITFLNGHDAVMLFLFGGSEEMFGAVSGLVIALLAGGCLYLAAQIKDR